MNPRIPTYLDCCDRCPEQPPMPPLLLTEAPSGTGVIADYACRCGNTWWTSWSWWDGVRHPTDGRAAA